VPDVRTTHQREGRIVERTLEIVGDLTHGPAEIWGFGVRRQWRGSRDLVIRRGGGSTDLESWSLGLDFFSTPRTTVSTPRTPTAALPLRAASRAYWTWKRWPSGEKTVMARS
jgi:hypothetical protein